MAFPKKRFQFGEFVFLELNILMVKKCEDHIVGSLVPQKELNGFKDGFLEKLHVVRFYGHVQDVDCPLDFLVIAVWVFGGFWDVFDGEHEIGEGLLIEGERLEDF
jgi:hypothetical protein